MEKSEALDAEDKEGSHLKGLSEMLESWKSPPAEICLGPQERLVENRLIA